MARYKLEMERELADLVRFLNRVSTEENSSGSSVASAGGGGGGGANSEDAMAWHRTPEGDTF